MSGLNTLTSSLQKYSVAGYEVGDRVGAGVVMDPATLTAKDKDNTKLVTVDLNLNGKKDPNDDQVLVKLPPKGFIPADWKGSATWGKGQKISAAGERIAGGTVIGAIGGAVLGLGAGAAIAEGGVLGAKLATFTVGLRAGIAIGIAGAITGGVIGYMTSDKIKGIDADAQNARSSAVPDMIPPKFILNQYTLQQQGNSTILNQMPKQSN